MTDDAPSQQCPTAHFGISASPAMTRIGRQASHFGVRKESEEILERRWDAWSRLLAIFRAVFGGMAKWVTEIDDPARIPEIVSRAFYTAVMGALGHAGER